MPASILKRPIRVLCVDDHPLVRKGIALILSNEADMELVGEAGNGCDAVLSFRQLRPDVTLMDLRMPQLDGIQAVKQIRAEFPDAKIIALTSFDGDQDIYRALAAGVRGYLLKESVHTEVLTAIRAVTAGERLISHEVTERLTAFFPREALTPKEVEVLTLVAQGLGNKEIAARLGKATGTIKIHVQNILEKLGASDRTHAVTIAAQRGIIHV
ncbi:MAG: response regulator transcription factor [Pirellulales bacterium]|nr:response regulator transcription factor [Pirellulales bacterium]